MRSPKTAPPNASLDRCRDDIVRDLNENVSVIDTQFFFDHLLPPSPLQESRTADDVVNKMKESGTIDGQRWAGWQNPSASAGVNEGKVFGKLSDLTKAIIRTAGLKGTPTVDFVCNGAISLASYTRNNSSKPDCYAILNPKVARRRFVADKLGTKQPLWLDVAVPGEFKKAMTPDGFNDVSRLHRKISHSP